MSRSKESLAAARLEERMARARWHQTLEHAKERAKPSVVVNEAVEGVQQAANAVANNATDFVKKRPATIVAAVSAIAIFAFRKPIVAAIKSRISRRTETKTETHEFRLEESTIREPKQERVAKTKVSEEIE